MYNTIAMKTIAEKLNDRTYTDYYYRLLLIARSMFKWNNLPNNINEKWIERFLCSEGFCIFFNDPIKGLMVARATNSGVINYYDEPITLIPHATGYTGKQLENGKDCIIIANNDLMIPTIPTLELFAYRLAEITRTIDINIDAQKTPIMMLCTERQKQSLKAVYKKYDGFEPVIYADKNLDLDGVKVLKTDAPIVFDKLQIHKHAIWNEAMTYLGINNANMDKRERLVDDEVQANNEQIDMCAQTFLKAREYACEMINKIFKTEISVEIRKEVLDLVKKTEKEVITNAS